MTKRVLIIGPAHPLRGGLATFNQRLAKAFADEGWDPALVSFSLQYPSLLFPGKTQYTEEPAPEGLTIHTMINSVNPANWIKVGDTICSWKPDLIIVRFWIPFIGASLGTLLRRVRKNRHTKILCIADNVIPHERRPGDKTLTRYFLQACDGFITMSDKVMEDLRKFETRKPARMVQHPLYDTFGSPVSKEEARAFLKLDGAEKIILFFGFIRKYKGLDILLDAMKEPALHSSNIRLLIAGEFYEDEGPYLQQIRENGLEHTVILRNRFIADSEVRYYLCAADCVVQPYRNATQSGVTPLAYHFEKPMVVTNVGGLPSLVPDGKVGLVCPPDPASIAAAILRFYELGEHYFIPHLRTEKQKYSWANLVSAITELAGSLER